VPSGQAVPEPPEVVLVHGLWYRAWSMRVLRERLEAAGFAVRCFSYPTRTRVPVDNAADLHEFARCAKSSEQHFVAHSLGGLVTLAMLYAAQDLPPGRLVLMGTPLQGSAVARRIARWPGGSWFMGKASEVLGRGDPTPSPGRETGMIAGVKPFGLGRLSGAAAGMHDGTVAVHETRSDVLTDRIELPVTHTGMLVSSEVARQAAYFLQVGRFDGKP